MKALIVGGTGPSGPFLANGLIERGYKVTIFHRGTHEIPEIVLVFTHRPRSLDCGATRRHIENALSNARRYASCP
jgi:2-polyprenyl-6-methoxyphenol hydroxylase-like FAD-dependent oxidoreductase